MKLPAALRSRMRPKTEKNEASSPVSPASAGQLQATEGAPEVNKANIKRATRMRTGFALAASFGYLLSWIFLVLVSRRLPSLSLNILTLSQVLIGNTSNRPVLKDTYFFKLNLADIIPTSVANANLINSIARSIGLHDFYQAGLWNFCEGYLNEYVLAPPTPFHRP